MIFDRRSNYMLKYEKAKSKLVEFDIKEKNYPRRKTTQNFLQIPKI